MDISVIFSVLCIVSFFCAAATGNFGELSAAVVVGAKKAVELSINLCGAMCLWNGVMRVASDSGAVGAVAKVMTPVLRLAFPHTFRRQNENSPAGQKKAPADNEGAESVSMLVAANLLGIGNAATPLALMAMKKLDDGDDRSADDMTTLAILGTASLDVIPTTLLSLRFAAGSSDPFSVVVPIWITSALCAVFAVTVSRSLALFGRAGAVRLIERGRISGVRESRRWTH